MGMRETQKAAHNAPLTNFDTETQTLGCRHTNPEICSSANLVNVCAFVTHDGLCRKPGRRWVKKYRELKNIKSKQEKSEKE